MRCLEKFVRNVVNEPVHTSLISNSLKYALELSCVTVLIEILEKIVIYSLAASHVSGVLEGPGEAVGQQLSH